MSGVWIYRVDLITIETPDGGEFAEIPDLTDFEVVTTDDESVGRIEESTEMGEKSWIVVDTGQWIFEKKRMIPAGAISGIDTEKRQVRVAMTKDDVKDAPDYHEVSRHEAFYQDEIEDYYRKYVPAGL